MALNRCVFCGRIVKIPEIKHTANGVAVCSFSICVERDFKDKSTGKPLVDFFDCVAWRNLAEFVNKFIVKGQLLNVEGRLSTRKFVDKAGQNRYAYEINVDNLYPVGQKPKEAEESSKQTDESWEVIDEFPEELPW